MTAFGGKERVASGFDAMTGAQLLQRFYMQGLQEPLGRIKTMLDMGDLVGDDRREIDAAEDAIRAKVNELSGSKAGAKIAHEDIAEYIRTKMQE